MEDSYGNSHVFFGGEVSVFVETSKKVEIQNLDPHYSDKRFKEPKTIFLESEFQNKKVGDCGIKGVHYVYSDRLFSWYPEEKFKEAIKAAERIQKNTAEYFEIYLQTLMDKPKLRLVHIMSGVNLSNGYPYRVYGFLDE